MGYILVCNKSDVPNGFANLNIHVFILFFVCACDVLSKMLKCDVFSMRVTDRFVVYYCVYNHMKYICKINLLCQPKKYL